MTMKNRNMDGNTPKKKKKKIEMRIPGFLTALLLFLLVMALIINSVMALSLFGTKVTNNDSIRVITGKTTSDQRRALEREAELNEQQEKVQKNGVISLTAPPVESGQNLDAIVGSRDDLLNALDLTYPDQGFLFKDDYQIIDELTHDNGILYKLQQIYNGCVVDGHILNVSVDTSGMIQYVDGYHANLQNFSTDTAIGSSEAEELAKKYLKANYQYNPDDITLYCADKSIISINNTLSVGYKISAYTKQNDFPLRYLFVDANEKEILYDEDIMEYERVSVDMPGQKLPNQTFYIEKQSDTEFLFKDSEANIEVYDANGAAIQDYCNGNQQIITWNGDTGNPVKAAVVDATANIERVCSFYKSMFDRIGLKDDPNADPIEVYVDVSKINQIDFTDNACMVVGSPIMMIGTKSSSASWTLAQYLDVLGHEYNHGILGEDSNSYNENTNTKIPENHEFSGINEGLADIFGEFVEDYCDDKQLNGTCNWTSGEERNAISPSGAEVSDAKDYSSKKTTGTDGKEHYVNNEHDACYIISHPVYLMTQGASGEKKIDNRQLAFLYYDLMRELSLSDTFKDMRRKLEHLVYFPGRFGSNYSLTQKQKESVLDAFDQVGIETDYKYHLTPKAELKIYDINKKPYKDALITLVTLDGDTIVQSQVTKKDKYKLPDVAPGLYTLIVEDKNSDGRMTFSVIVNDNARDQKISDYRKKDDVFTNFGGDSGHVALLLDTSGSMDGTPIKQVRQAAENFVSTMHRDAPNVSISLIEFATDVNLLDEKSNDPKQLISHIRGISDGGDTNIYAALDMAQGLLAEDEHPVILIMGDGLPNKGKNDNGDYTKPISEKAEELRNKGTKIYSFGFFHSLSGSDLSSGQSMMRSIGSSGYSYNVTDANSSDINAVFQNIAYQISHRGNTTHVEVSCPVDVTVRYNGEELSSKEGGNRQTSFGLLTFEGENNEIKILNLKTGPDYEIIIEGYDTGTMDYSISYSDKDGNYVDTRTFEGIPITNGTFINTSAGESGKTEMKVDKDGNGTVDYTYTSGKDSNGHRTLFVANNGLLVFFLIMTALFLAIYGILTLIDLLKKRKYTTADGRLRFDGGLTAGRFNDKAASQPFRPRFCGKCGSLLDPGSNFCGKCGNPVVKIIEPDNNSASSWKSSALSVTKSPNGIRITQIVLSSILAIEIIVVLMINGLPATTVYRKLAGHEYISANHIYENKVRDTHLEKSYLSFLTDRYVRKAESAHDAGRINEQTLEDILTTVADMEMGKASDTAQEFLDQ